jgi:hypothetical protein
MVQAMPDAQIPELVVKAMWAPNVTYEYSLEQLRMVAAQKHDNQKVKLSKNFLLTIRK